MSGGQPPKCDCPSAVSFPRSAAEFRELIGIAARIRRNLVEVRLNSRVCWECRHCGSRWVRFELPERLPIPVFLSHNATRAVRQVEVQHELETAYREMCTEFRERVYDAMPADDAEQARQAYRRNHPTGGNGNGRAHRGGGAADSGDA